MTDTLRDRILNILIHNTPPKYLAMPGDLSDLVTALIDGLGLQPETLYFPGGAVLTRLDGKVLADNRYMTRWATPWKTDDRPVK